MNYIELNEKLTQAEAEISQGKFQEAAELAKEALSAVLQLKASGSIEQTYEIECTNNEAHAIRIIGQFYESTGKNREAFEQYEHSLVLYEKSNDSNGKARLLSMIGHLHWKFSDYPKAMEFYGKSLLLDEELGNTKYIANTTGNMGSVYLHLSDYQKAIEYYNKAMKINEESGDKRSVAKWLGNIGTVYLNTSDYSKALEYYYRCLAIIIELGDKKGEAAAAGNIGLVFRSLSEFQKGLEYTHRALAIYVSYDDKQGIAINSGNIGILYESIADYDKALEYYGKALILHSELNNNRGIAINTGNLGNVYLAIEDYSKAFDHLSRALELSMQIGEAFMCVHWLLSLGRLYSIPSFEQNNIEKAEEYLQSALSESESSDIRHIALDSSNLLYELYKNSCRWREALEMKEKNDRLKEEINKDDAKKKADKFDFEMKEAEREKQRAIEKAHLEATEALLHNILPKTIANRMMEKKTTISDYFENVSIFFSDIVDFTTLSTRISPQQLVEGLNSFFSEFDRIAIKHGLEKIKTIGDSYMAVCGAPEPYSNHAERMTLFALEVLEASKNMKLGDTAIDMRIGLHCGNVVAGVIGENKFAYDMWGDSVNTASRMESYGEAGKIHVSEDFTRAVGAHSALYNISFTPRGEMDIKGKGMMKTYFLEKK